MCRASGRAETWGAPLARLMNVVLAGLISLGIGLPWYLNNLDSLQAFLDFNPLLAALQEGEAPIWDFVLPDARALTAELDDPHSPISANSA